jgi:hypothetical protein
MLLEHAMDYPLYGVSITFVRPRVNNLRKKIKKPYSGSKSF